MKQKIKLVWPEGGREAQNQLQTEGGKDTPTFDPFSSHKKDGTWMGCNPVRGGGGGGGALIFVTGLAPWILPTPRNTLVWLQCLTVGLWTGTLTAVLQRTARGRQVGTL